MNVNSPLSENILTHRPYYYYLQLLVETIDRDSLGTKTKSIITNLLPYFNETPNLKNLRSQKALLRKKFVKTVMIIYRLLSNCSCCDRYIGDEFDMLTQILRLMILNLYAIYFNYSIQVSDHWNRELLISNDINRYIAKNNIFHSLFRYNNDLLSEILFQEFNRS